MMRNYWYMKSEPYVYHWDDLVKDGSTFWDGVRNYQARNNMKNMKIGDIILYYHSNKGVEFVGIAEVIKEAYQDPTTEDDRWVAVDIKPLIPLENPVSLKEIKNHAALQDMDLVKQSRLSVGSVKKKEFDYILSLAGMKSKDFHEKF